MTDTEKAIMADAYHFLRDYSDPPPFGHPSQIEWWRKAADAMMGIGTKHDNHPLVLAVLPALYEYLADKQKVTGAGR